jgi:hypothetical protein
MKKHVLLFLPVIFFSLVASTCCDGLDTKFQNAIFGQDSIAKVLATTETSRSVLLTVSNAEVQVTFREKCEGCVDLDSAITTRLTRVLGAQKDPLATLPDVVKGGADINAPQTQLIDPGSAAIGEIATPRPPQPPKNDPDLINVKKYGTIYTGFGNAPLMVSVHSYKDMGVSNITELKSLYTDLQGVNAEMNLFSGVGASNKGMISVERFGYTTAIQDLGDGNFVRIGGFDRNRIGEAIGNMTIK